MRTVSFVLLVLALLASSVAADQRGRARRADAQTRPQAGTLRPGDLAPDFTLDPVGGGTPITLSSFRGRPVALVFGSYT